MATVQYLSWSSFLFTSDEGCRIVVDPLIAGSTEHGLPPSPVSPSDLFGVDLVLVSHAAWDHLGQAIEIVKGGNAKLGSYGDVWIHAMSEGVDVKRRMNMTFGSHYAIKDVTVIPVPAKHTSVSQLKDGQWLFGLPQSYFIEFGDGRTVFFGGDTSISVEFELYQKLYHPSTAILGVSGVPHTDRPPTRELPPLDAALTASMLGVHSVIPCHYMQGESVIEDVIAECAALDKPVECHPLVPGQTLEIKVPTK